MLSSEVILFEVLSNIELSQSVSRQGQYCVNFQFKEPIKLQCKTDQESFNKQISLNPDIIITV